MTDTIIKATAGITAVEAVNQVPPINNTIEILKLAIQLIIGIVSIFHIRKNKNGL